MKGGAYSRRMRFALMTLMSVPEYRHVIRMLHAGGEQAHRDVTELLLAATRLLYDRPVNDELRRLVDQAAAAYINRVGPVDARKAAGIYHRKLGLDDLGRTPLGRNRIEKNADPVFREFARVLAGLKLAPPDEAAASPQTSEQLTPDVGADPRVQPTHVSARPTPRTAPSASSRLRGEPTLEGEVLPADNQPAPPEDARKC
jgi:hypothetical protein